MRILSGGNVGIGTTSPTAKLQVAGDVNIGETLNVGTTTPSYNTNYGTGDLNVENDLFASAQIFTHNDTAGNFSFLGLGKSSGTGASPTVVQANERIAVLGFYGYDGAAYKRLASIDAYVDGTPGTNDMPGKLLFNTTSDGSSSPTTRLTIGADGNATFTGDVGIGKTPSEKLDVEGNIQAINTAGTAVSYVDIVSGATWRLASNPTSGTNSYGLDIIKGSGGTDVKMSIDSSGNVGIGTTSPGYPLEVDGGVGSGVKIKAGNGSSDDSFLVSNNDDVSKFLVQGDGKVIINSSAGISGRTENFQVFGKQIITNTGTSGPVLYLGYNSSGANTIQLGRGRTADGLSYMDFNGEVMPAGQFGFRIIRYSGQNASTELNQVGTGAFKVTCSNSADIILNPNSGSVGISQTNPSYKLDVTGNGRFTSTVTATNFILSSDERLKENVEKVCDNKVEADWKTFELKTEKGQKRYGVIAQELEKTNPEFVREDVDGFKSVAYIDLLIAKIAELEARLEKLEK